MLSLKHAVYRRTVTEAFQPPGISIAPLFADIDLYYSPLTQDYV
jgi:hypothetical protein